MPVAGNQQRPADADKVLHRRIKRLRQRLTGTEEALARHAGDLDGLLRFQAYAADRLAEADRLLDHVRSTPGAHVGAMRVRDASGAETMGYVDRDAGDEQAAYVQFEDLFRGSRQEIQSRQRPYLDLVRGRGRVLDLGCGRGEFLELLRDADVPATGVDLDTGMVAVAVDLGLDARVRDLFDELGQCPDESVGCIVTFQVVEHLEPPDMRRLLREAHRVLSSGGVVIIETVNPHALRAFRFFHLDLTHTIPVFPESLLSVARAAGFQAAVAYFPESTQSLATDLRECGDYALVCAKHPDVLTSLGLLES